MAFEVDLRLPEKEVLLSQVNHDNGTNLLPNQVSFGDVRRHPSLINRYIVPMELTDLDTGQQFNADMSYTKVSIQELFMITGVVVPTHITEHVDFINYINHKYQLSLKPEEVITDVIDADTLELTINATSKIYIGRYRAVRSDDEWFISGAVIDYWNCPPLHSFTLDTSVDITAKNIPPTYIINTPEMPAIEWIVEYPDYIVTEPKASVLLKDAIFKVEKSVSVSIDVSEVGPPVPVFTAVPAFTTLPVTDMVHPFTIVVEYPAQDIFDYELITDTFVSIEGILNEQN